MDLGALGHGDLILGLAFTEVRIALPGGHYVRLIGTVHDPRARKMEGVAGHAGLFGTADDLAIYCRMILNNGEMNGKRILTADTVTLFTEPRPVPGRG